MRSESNYLSWTLEEIANLFNYHKLVGDFTKFIDDFWSNVSHGGTK